VKCLFNGSKGIVDMSSSKITSNNVYRVQLHGNQFYRKTPIHSSQSHTHLVLSQKESSVRIQAHTLLGHL